MAKNPKNRVFLGIYVLISKIFSVEMIENYGNVQKIVLFNRYFFFNN